MSTKSGGLSRRDLATWVRFAAGFSSLVHALDRRLRDESGLSIDDFGVLRTLWAAPRPGIPMNELAEALAFSPSRLTHGISRMESNGWVQRQVDDEDRRIKLVSLTAEGREVLEAAWPGHAAAIRELFIDQIADEDRHAIEDTFSRIRTRIRGADGT